MRVGDSGEVMTVPKGANAAGVNGSGWSRVAAGGLIDGRVMVKKIRL